MKYRRQILTPEVELSFKDICLEIEQKHEIRFLEIGVADEHVHMLVQGIPTMPVTNQDGCHHQEPDRTRDMHKASLSQEEPLVG